MPVKRGKEEWVQMSVSELTHIMARRYARVEVLKQEIRELQMYIDKKTKEKIK
jgi:hypothetical protein